MSAYDPILSEDKFTDVDYRWLGSRLGLVNAKTHILNASAFPESEFPEGRIRGGQTLARVEGQLVPFNPEGTDGSEIFFGVLANDRSIKHGDEICPVMWTGLIHTAFLPEASKVPTTGTGQITFR